MPTYKVMTLDCSDGNEVMHPANTTQPPPDADGTWEFYREVDIQESKGVLWLTKVAAALVDEYTNSGDGREYILDKLPKGYKLFEHVKGKKDGIRKDTYLIGHPSGSRFRSPAEFIPHAFYLAAQDPANAGPTAKEHSTCACKYCRGPGAVAGFARKPQKTADGAMKEVAAKERLGEQEMAGWMMRKGEIVWVWTGKPEALDNPAKIEDSKKWAAGVVVIKPTVNTSFRRQQAGLFVDIEMEEDTKEDSTYEIQLCGSKDGGKLRGVQQHCIRPWLARPKHIHPKDQNVKEHDSIPAARAIVRTFNFFDVNRTVTTLLESNKNKAQRTATLFNGIFLGAEKIFSSEPVRIRNPKTGLEDVLVIDNLYVCAPTSSDGKRSTNILLSGSVYSTGAAAENSPDHCPLTPEQFSRLPFRMRRVDPSTKQVLKWYLQNQESSELSLKLVQGRWYEPDAVQCWMSPNGGMPLAGQGVEKWVGNRSDALGWTTTEGLALMTPGDGKTAPKAQLAASWGDEMEGVEMTTSPQTSVTLGRGFKSVNKPVRVGKSRMVMAARDEIEDEGEEEEEERMYAGMVPEEEILGQSPTKRLQFRF